MNAVTISAFAVATVIIYFVASWFIRTLMTYDTLPEPKRFISFLTLVMPGIIMVGLPDSVPGNVGFQLFGMMYICGLALYRIKQVNG